jgi:diguanylate cyclase (GGDEF)-like protein
VADGLAGLTYASPLVWIFNGLGHMVSFSLVSFLIGYLQKSRAAELELARRDPLTGLANSRAFRESIDMELERQKRYNTTLSITYLDLDDFKGVNDSLGHQAGDFLLKCLADIFRKECRATDVPARLGGDEFAVLLPYTEMEGTREFLDRIIAKTTAIMKANDWPVTMSIGAVTFRSAALDADEMIRKADNLMYRVKNSGKNAVWQEVFPERDGAV